jgi:hypothetical protein
VLPPIGNDHAHGSEPRYDTGHTPDPVPTVWLSVTFGSRVSSIEEPEANGVGERFSHTLEQQAVGSRCIPRRSHYTVLFRSTGLGKAELVGEIVGVKAQGDYLIMEINTTAFRSSLLPEGGGVVQGATVSGRFLAMWHP